VAITGDQARPDGSTVFGDIGLERLDERGIEWAVIPVPGPALTAEQLQGFDALLMMGGKSIESAALPATSLRHVARFGAGFDALDVDACTASGVMLTNTPDAVRVPMAHTALALVFALAHNLVIKDRLVRTKRWEERPAWQGRGLDGATVGIVGLGGIGAETASLLCALGLNVVAYNRTPRPELVEALGIRQLSLQETAATSDFLIVTVAGNPGTSDLIDADILALMPRGSFLVNVARGSVVDEAALVEALRRGHLRGAGLDVFRHEPLEADSPLIGMDEVVLSPHSLSWTDAFARGVADSAIAAIIDVAEGRRPQHLVNPGALFSEDGS
jgi:phosphoglycerate dehydrogenase-like enzyme